MIQVNKQAGFTLIELIMVIVILGVLSAFALPRFADLGGNARGASLTGAAGSMKAAANIAHAAQLAGGLGVNEAVELEGATIQMSNGYPTDAGIMLAAQISSPDYNVTGDTVTIPGASDDTTCRIVYAEAVAGTLSPLIPQSPATVDLDTTGC